MLEANLKTQLKGYLERLTQPVEIIASVDDNDKSREMLELLNDIISLSPLVTLDPAAMARFCEPIVKRKSALLRKQQNRHCSELFSDRADGKACAFFNQTPSLHIGKPIAVLECDLAIPSNRKGKARRCLQRERGRPNSFEGDVWRPQRAAQTIRGRASVLLALVIRTYRERRNRSGVNHPSSASFVVEHESGDRRKSRRRSCDGLRCNALLSRRLRI